MSDDHASVRRQKAWKVSPAQNELEKNATLRKLKAETAYFENEDRRKEELHAAGLLHMLMQIEKAKIAPRKNGAQTLKDVSDTTARGTYASASKVVQKYIDNVLNTSSLDIAAELLDHNSAGLPFAKKIIDKKA